MQGGVKMIIYRITNKVNGMQYVGQTVRKLEERFAEHCRKKQGYLGRAIQKYGKENFDIEVLDSSLIIDDLNAKEIYWIEKSGCKFPNGYNLASGGNSIMGYKHSEESKKKMSMVKRSKGSAVGEKNHFYGKKHTEETKKKLREAWASGRRVLTEEHKEVLRKAHVTKCVRNITTGEVFTSIKSAAEKYDIKPTHISRVCRGRRKRTGGFEWEYYIESSK